MTRREVKFASEAELCAAFCTWATRQGWTPYAETAGFDVLLVEKSGAQIGIEAKLRTNVKVIEQALPSCWDSGEVGPDHRAILVPDHPGEGIVTALAFVGVEVFYATSAHWRGDRFDFVRGNRLSEMHDWNPARRCALPEFVPDVAAGVPAPVQLTKWKIGALRVLALLEIDGSVTKKEIAGAGIDPRRWCAGDNWLRVVGDGRYSRGDCPAFDQQHPDVYAKVRAELIARRAGSAAA